MIDSEQQRDEMRLCNVHPLTPTRRDGRPLCRPGDLSQRDTYRFRSSRRRISTCTPFLSPGEEGGETGRQEKKRVEQKKMVSLALSFLVLIVRRSYSCFSIS